MKSKASIKINSFFQKGFNFAKTEMFSKEYFQFILTLNLKKKAIYINLIVYCLLILTCTIIAPLIVGYQPILFLSYPVLSLILVLIVAVVASYITVEIFRTPIDDGTELIALSKPLHRSQIFFCKCLVLSMIGTGIAISGGLISIFGMLISFIDKTENWIVIGGMFVGTIICFAVFGSITIIASLFSNKIISLLVSSGVAFLLIVTSILSSLTIDSKSNVNISNFTNNTEKIAYMNIDENGKSNTIEGYKSKSSYSKIIPSYWYAQDFQNKTYPKFAYGDFGQQLSSIFTLNSAAKDVFAKEKIMNTMLSPHRLSFSDVKDFTNFTGTSINVSFSDSSTGDSGNASDSSDSNNDSNDSATTDYSQNLLFVPLYSSKIYQSDTTNLNIYYTKQIYTLYDYNNQKLADANKDFLEFENIINYNFNVEWKKFIEENKEEATSDILSSNQSNTNLLIWKYLAKLFAMTNNVTSDTLSNFFANCNINSYSARINAINNLNQLIYTGIYRYFVKSSFTMADLEKISKEIEDIISSKDATNYYGLEAMVKNYINQIVFLRLMYVNFEKGATTVKNKIEKNSSSLNTTKEYIESFLSSSLSSTNGVSFEMVNASNNTATNSPPKYSFESTFRILPSSYFTNFQEVKYVSLYNTYALFASWIAFSTIITLISLVIYRQKDFK